MTNAMPISRGQIIAGLCLPLAVLVGYMLAEPMDSTGMGVVLLVFCVLGAPILMRWHHPLLLFSWNACVSPYFLPGRPFLWMLMALVGFFFAVINRATDSGKRFVNEPLMNWPLMALMAVVGATALATGGFGVQAMGGESFGGKGYFYITFAIIGYFAMTSQTVPRRWAGLVVVLFFLSGVTALAGNLIYMGGQGWYYLFEFFPPEGAVSQATADYSPVGMTTRIWGASLASQAVWCALLSVHGLGGMFVLRRPWRLGLFVAMMAGGLLSGYRTDVAIIALVLAALFFLEKLWETRVSFYLLLAGGLAAAGLLLFSDQLPLPVQRAISFLPVKVDVTARADAQESTEWRIEMWKKIAPDVPRYLFKGKGYSINAQDMYFANESIRRGFLSGGDFAAMVGDYHNGPLSVVIPFGIYGAVAFGWLLVAGLCVLARNWRHGDAELRRINCFLLALYCARLLFFLFVYGSLYHDLFQFTGLVGLSVALNGKTGRREGGGQ